MIISLKRYRPFIIIFLIIVISLFLLKTTQYSKVKPVMGGWLHTATEFKFENASIASNSVENLVLEERFQRPSKHSALKLKYGAKDFIKDSEKPVHIEEIFVNPEDVIHAYYSILKDASNMSGYYGGCGTIGSSKIPYPYAYQLLSDETKKQITLNQFIDSFSGTGHMTLLKLYPSYNSPETNKAIKYYMVEIEVITGFPMEKNNINTYKGSVFAYYYGLVTTERKEEGWKIKTIDYFAEDFLCHPLHHWDYDAEFLVNVVYKDWYGLIEKIEKIEEENSNIYIFAVGGKNRYRFDFVRLTNGDDLLLHEYIIENGGLTEVNLLKKEHERYKFSAIF